MPFMKTIGLELQALAGLAIMVAAPVAMQAADASDNAATVYVAHLRPMNRSVTEHNANGEARFTIAGDNMTIRIDMRGVPPSLEHWQHFHGFKDNQAAACPVAAADANHDGVIDLIETGAAAGTTMVPFNADPVRMHVASDTYPKASADGTYDYRKTVSLKAMTAAFAKAFGNPDLALDRRVVFVHGVAPAAALAGSVASLGTIPAQVTLPIACGKIERVAK
jgi:hypothetical protein